MWKNITKDAPEDAPFKKVLGGKWEDQASIPNAKTLQQMVEIAKMQTQKEAERVDGQCRKNAKRKMNDDLKQGAAIAHQAVKGVLGGKKEFVPPPPEP